MMLKPRNKEVILLTRRFFSWSIRVQRLLVNTLCLYDVVCWEKLHYEVVKEDDVELC